MIALRPPSRRAPCDLCGQRRFAPIASRDRRGRPLRTVICRDCGLVRHWHLPSERELARFYARAYRETYHGEYRPSNKRIFRAWIEGRRILRVVHPYLQPHWRVLEVGAGIGCTVKVFADHGLDAWGIEPHAGFQRFAEEQWGTRITRESLQQHCPATRYDLVLLIHVIEHLRTPVEAMQRIHGWLKPNGLLYVECPNLAAPFAAPGKWFHFAHTYNFTPITLQAVAARGGFEVVTWTKSPKDPNLGLLARRVPAGSVAVSWEGGYEQVLTALRRYNVLTYHLRPSYLAGRVGKLGRYAVERLLADAFQQAMLRRLRSSVDPVVKERRAA